MPPEVIPAAPPAGDPPPAPPVGDPPPAPPAGDPPPTAPAALTLALSEGSALDVSDLEKVLSYATTHKLSQDQAAALLKQHEDSAAAVLSRRDAAHQDEQAGWIEAVKQDKEIGGQHLATTFKCITLAMDRFAPGADHPFRRFLNDTGNGNHPEYIRFAAAIGKQLMEEPPVNPGPQDGGSNGNAPLERRMYPNNP